MAYACDLVVVGGGAAGFFGAIQRAERQPGARIVILEKSPDVLSKVRISGGGRCNVTHACFDPRAMVKHYPRGERELLGPFHRFLCGDMVQWLADQGVDVVAEPDGRMFPATHDSETIIDLFKRLCREYRIEVITSAGVTALQTTAAGWTVATREGHYTAPHVLWATGSTPSALGLLQDLGLEMVAPVPSLFTFNIQDPLLKDLAGVSVPSGRVSIAGQKLSAEGPVLITHWGLSGPAILRLSAWGARQLHALNYDFEVEVNWTGKDRAQVEEAIHGIRKRAGSKVVKNELLPGIPRRLWERLVHPVAEERWGDLNKAQLEQILGYTTALKLVVHGKSTFKDEFVTAGGVDLKEVDFKTFQAKRFPGLFLAGEVLNIDGITGGFNFQSAWTGAWVAAEAMVENA
jgi:predicted Rossmann fold flavoprotein